MRPGRPIGLTIALLACTILYGIYPLLEAVLFISVNARMGSGISARLAMALVMGVAFLLLLIPAWRGRPPAIRLILIGAVLVVAVINLAFLLGDAAAQQNPFELNAASQIGQTINTCSLLAQLAIPLYVVWYLSRYPSRNYYAGRRADD